MGCLFFKKGGVSDYASATKSDTKQFARFFSGLLHKGIYIAPSQFESMFISAAHTTDDLNYTYDSIKAIIETLFA